MASVRQENPKDHKRVYEVNTLAFKQEDEAKLVDNLRENSEVFIPEMSLVAVHDQIAVLGYILFVKVKIDSHDNLALALLSVSLDIKSSGIGKILVKEGLQFAIVLGFKSVIVLRHANYYSKIGFENASR